MRRAVFIEWLSNQLAKYRSSKLEKVWHRVYQRAMGDSDTAAKLYVERWDGNYRPTTKTDNTHRIAGLKSDLPTDKAKSARFRVRELAGLEKEN